jgi:hypothetical protein
MRVDAAVDQVLDAAAAKVVHQAAREPDRGARPLPELPEVADGLAISPEDPQGNGAPFGKSTVRAAFNFNQSLRGAIFSLVLVCN